MLHLQTKELRDALNLLRRHVSVENIQLKTMSANCLAVMATTPYERGITYIDCQADEFSHFGINVERLNKICTGRGRLELRLAGTDLRFGSEDRHYKGQISILPSEDITIMPPDRPKLPKEFQHIAKHYLPMLKLSDIQGNRDLAVMLRYNNGLELSVTDMLHAAIIITKLPIQLNQNLPLSLALKLSALLVDDNSGYMLANNSLYCWNTKLELQHTIIGELVESAQVITVMKQLTAPLALAKIDAGILRTICHNLHAVYEDSSVITISLLSDGLNLICSSSHGTITDKLIAEIRTRASKLTITVNFSTLMDVLDNNLQTGLVILEFRPSLNNQVIMCLRYAIDSETEVIYYIIAFAQ